MFMAVLDINRKKGFAAAKIPGARIVEFSTFLPINPIGRL
jgi:hypothetical protein